MAEAEGGAAAGDDETLAPGYTAPAEASIADMMKSDGKEDEDEALQRWKAQLLAGAEGMPRSLLSSFSNKSKIKFIGSRSTALLPPQHCGGRRVKMPTFSVLLLGV
jgi:hypothetical protein